MSVIFLVSTYGVRSRVEGFCWKNEFGTYVVERRGVGGRVILDEVARDGGVVDKFGGYRR